MSDYRYGLSRPHHAHVCWDKHSGIRGARTLEGVAYATSER